MFSGHMYLLLYLECISYKDVFYHQPFFSLADSKIFTMLLKRLE